MAVTLLLRELFDVKSLGAVFGRFNGSADGCLTDAKHRTELLLRHFDAVRVSRFETFEAVLHIPDIK